MVSVIMNCFNGGEYLQEAIDSVYSQTYKDWEIIFWNNASTDNSESIARSYNSKLRYFKSEKKMTLGEARNKALEKAKGDVLAFLDVDDIWLPKKLEKQVDKFREKNVGIVYSDAIFFNNHGENFNLYEKHPYYTGKCFSKLLVHNFLCFSSVAIRMKAINEQDEYFDERFSFIEEADLINRISLRWNLEIVKEPLVKWRVHKQSITTTQGYLVIEETEMMLEKYKSIFENFNQIYSSEIKNLRKNAALSGALSYKKNKNSKKARYVLIRSPIWTFKLFIFFFLSFLPNKIFFSTITFFRKSRMLNP